MNRVRTISPRLARHAVVALSGYASALEAAGRPVPADGYEDLLSWLSNVDKTGQTVAIIGTVSDDDNEPLLGLTEAAALVGASTRTLRRAITAGTLDATWTGTRWRIAGPDLARWIDSKGHR